MTLINKLRFLKKFKKQTKESRTQLRGIAEAQYNFCENGRGGG